MDDRRYYGLDALRGGMMMLGIVLHAAMFYLANPPPTGPMPTDANNSVIFDWIFHFIHSFRMPTFFVLSGFFTALLVEKRGVWGTYRNRAARIFLPLLAGVFTLLPLTLVLMLDFMVAARYNLFNWLPEPGDLEALGSAMRARVIGVTPGDHDVPLAHLWFLYYLCWFYLLIPLCRWLVARSLPHEARISRALTAPWMYVLFSLWTTATLWPFFGGQVQEGFMFVMPHPPSLLYYGSFFVLGYAFHHYRAFLQSLVPGFWRWALLAAVLFPITLYVSHLDVAARGHDAWLHLASTLVNGLCTWALIYAFIGGALRFFDRDTPWIQYVSQSSYWVFLVHMPLVTLAAFLLLPYDAPAIVKFLLACAFTSVAAFLTFHYWVQKTWMSVFLHGRHFDLRWPWQAGGIKGARPALTPQTPPQ